MTLETKTCLICGQPKNSPQGGSFTQWVSLCRCDEIEAGGEALHLTCVICGKQIQESKTGSFTQWVMQSQRCLCPEPIPFGKSGSDSEKKSRANLVSQARSSGKTARVISGDEKDSFPLDRYTPLNQLGTGGSASVYLCFDKHLQKQVAVKVLKQYSADQLEQFQSEAKVTAKIQHQNIVSILDFGLTSEAAPYMVLEYIDGTDLSSMIAEYGRLDQNLAMDLFIQIAAGLIKAHEQGVYHRDVKSSNVIVSVDDRGQVMAYIIDFGIAVVGGGTAGIHGKALIGTPKYMSPDQFLGREFDERSEIYSFGCLMYEVLAARVPFPGSDPLALLEAHAADAVPWFSEVDPSLKISNELEKIVRRCLEKDPDDRYQTMREVISDLNKIELTELVEPEEQDSNGELAQIAIEEAGGAQTQTEVKASHNRLIRTVALLSGLSMLCVAIIGYRLFQSESNSNRQPAPTKSQKKKELLENPAQQMVADTRLDSVLDGGPLSASAQKESEAIEAEQERNRVLQENYTLDISLKGGYPELYRQRAQAYKIQGKYPEAIEDINRAIEIDPTDVANYLALARLQYETGLYTKSSKTINTAGKLAPGDYKVYLAGGELYVFHAPKIAEAMLDKAISFNPKAAEPYAVRALARALQHKSMSDDMDNALALGGADNAVINTYLGAAMREKDPERALEFLNKAVKKSPGYYWPYWLRANIYTLARERKNALDNLNKVIKLNPHNCIYLESRAMNLGYIDEFDAAIADMDSALKLSPKTAQYHENKGHFLLGKGDVDKAMEEYDRAIAMGGGTSKMYFNKAKSLADRKKYTESIEALNKCIELEPSAGRGYLVRAEVYSKIGEDEKAIADYTRYLKTKPTDSRVLALRAEAYEKIGKTNLAKRDRAEVESYTDVLDSTYQAGTPARNANEKLQDVDAGRD